MKRLIIFFFITIFFACSFLYYNSYAQDKKFVPFTFFCVHCEPTGATEERWSAAVEFFDIALTYNVKLTIQFSPQYAEMILKDKKKIEKVWEWKRAGHEISSHHHGPSHGFTWDGYSNKTQEQIQAARERSFRGQGQMFRFPFRGGMDEFIKPLNELIYPDRILSMCGTDEDTDIPPGILYLVNGIRPEDARDVLRVREFNGREIYSLSIALLTGQFEENMVKRLAEEREKAKPGEVIGVVTHVFNFIRDREKIIEWMKFLYKNNPEGIYNKTVSELIPILISEIVASGGEIAKGKPNLGPARQR